MYSGTRKKIKENSLLFLSLGYYPLAGGASDKYILVHTCMLSAPPKKDFLAPRDPPPPTTW
jgi:hypothetical protein